MSSTYVNNELTTSRGKKSSSSVIGKKKLNEKNEMNKSISDFCANKNQLSKTSTIINNRQSFDLVNGRNFSTNGIKEKNHKSDTQRPNSSLLKRNFTLSIPSKNNKDVSSNSSDDEVGNTNNISQELNITLVEKELCVEKTWEEEQQAIISRIKSLVNEISFWSKKNDTSKKKEFMELHTKKQSIFQKLFKDELKNEVFFSDSDSDEENQHIFPESNKSNPQLLQSKIASRSIHEVETVAESINRISLSLSDYNNKEINTKRIDVELIKENNEIIEILPDIIKICKELPLYDCFQLVENKVRLKRHKNPALDDFRSSKITTIIRENGKAYAETYRYNYYWAPRNDLLARALQYVDSMGYREDKSFVSEIFNHAVSTAVEETCRGVRVLDEKYAEQNEANKELNKKNSLDCGSKLSRLYTNLTSYLQLISPGSCIPALFSTYQKMLETSDKGKLRELYKHHESIKNTNNDCLNVYLGYDTPPSLCSNEAYRWLEEQEYVIAAIFFSIAIQEHKGANVSAQQEDHAIFVDIPHASHSSVDSSALHRFPLRRLLPPPRSTKSSLLVSQAFIPNTEWSFVSKNLVQLSCYYNDLSDCDKASSVIRLVNNGTPGEENGIKHDAAFLSLLLERSHPIVCAMVLALNQFRHRLGGGGSFSDIEVLKTQIKHFVESWIVQARLLTMPASIPTPRGSGMSSGFEDFICVINNHNSTAVVPTPLSGTLLQKSAAGIPDSFVDTPIGGDENVLFNYGNIVAGERDPYTSANCVAPMGSFWTLGNGPIQDAAPTTPSSSDGSSPYGTLLKRLVVHNFTSSRSEDTGIIGSIMHCIETGDLNSRYTWPYLHTVLGSTLGVNVSASVGSQCTTHEQRFNALFCSPTSVSCDGVPIAIIPAHALLIAQVLRTAVLHIEERLPRLRIVDIPEVPPPSHALHVSYISALRQQCEEAILAVASSPTVFSSDFESGNMGGCVLRIDNGRVPISSVGGIRAKSLLKSYSSFVLNAFANLFSLDEPGTLQSLGCDNSGPGTRLTPAGESALAAFTNMHKLHSSTAHFLLSVVDDKSGIIVNSPSSAAVQRDAVERVSRSNKEITPTSKPSEGHTVMHPALCGSKVIGVAINHPSGPTKKLWYYFCGTGGSFQHGSSVKISLANISSCTRLYSSGLRPVVCYGTPLHSLLLATEAARNDCLNSSRRREGSGALNSSMYNTGCAGPTFSFLYRGDEGLSGCIYPGNWHPIPGQCIHRVIDDERRTAELQFIITLAPALSTKTLKERVGAFTKGRRDESQDRGLSGSLLLCAACASAYHTSNRRQMLCCPYCLLLQLLVLRPEPSGVYPLTDRLNTVLSLVVTQPLLRPTVHISFCEPYSYSNLLSNICLFRRLVRASSAAIKFEERILCRTLEGRKQHLFIITDLQGGSKKQEFVTECARRGDAAVRLSALGPYVDSGKGQISYSYVAAGPSFAVSFSEGKKVVLLSGRVHPGEVTASHGLHGLVQFLLSSDPRAARLRDNFIFFIVPMMNPDGVARGHTRLDEFGFNLNRSYNAPGPKEVTVVALRDIFLYLQSTFKERFFLYVDFHSHASQPTAFLFGNYLSSAYQQWNLFFAKLIEASSCGLLSSKLSKFGRTDTVLKDGCSRVLFGELGMIHSYTIELSHFARLPWCPITGVLPPPPSHVPVGMNPLEADKARLVELFERRAAAVYGVEDLAHENWFSLIKSEREWQQRTSAIISAVENNQLRRSSPQGGAVKVSVYNSAIDSSEIIPTYVVLRQPAEVGRAVALALLDYCALDDITSCPYRGINWKDLLNHVVSADGRPLASSNRFAAGPVAKTGSLLPEGPPGTPQSLLIRGLTRPTRAQSGLELTQRRPSLCGDAYLSPSGDIEDFAVAELGPRPVVGPALGILRRGGMERLFREAQKECMKEKEVGPPGVAHQDKASASSFSRKF